MSVATVTGIVSRPAPPRSLVISPNLDALLEHDERVRRAQSSAVPHGLPPPPRRPPVPVQRSPGSPQLFSPPAPLPPLAVPAQRSPVLPPGLDHDDQRSNTPQSVDSNPYINPAPQWVDTTPVATAPVPISPPPRTSSFGQGVKRDAGMDGRGFDVGVGRGQTTSNNNNNNAPVVHRQSDGSSHSQFDSEKGNVKDKRENEEMSLSPSLRPSRSKGKPIKRRGTITSTSTTNSTPSRDTSPPVFEPVRKQRSARFLSVSSASSDSERIDLFSPSNQDFDSELAEGPSVVAAPPSPLPHPPSKSQLVRDPRKARSVSDPQPRDKSGPQSNDKGRAVYLSQQQPEDVDLRRSIEASLTDEGRGRAAAHRRPPWYATRHTRGTHDAPAPTGREKRVSADSFEERHAPKPMINGTSEHGDSIERDFLDLSEDDESGQDSNAQHREIEPKDSPRLPGPTQISPSAPSIGSSPQFPLQPTAVQVFQRTSVLLDILFSFPKKRSPIHEVDPDIRSGSQDSSLEDLSKSGSSSSGSPSVTPSTSPEPLVVAISTAPTSPHPLPQLPSQWPHEWTAERTDPHDKRRPINHTSSATESESNVSAGSSEGPPSWKTEAYIDSLLAGWERRRPLLSMVMLPDADRPGLSGAQVHQSLADVEAQISALLIHIIGSREARCAAQRLESDRAQAFMDALQDALDRGTLPDSRSRSKARHLMQKVFEAKEQLPSSLFIEGVNDHDEHPTFGGGFGDVYQASYQGKMVALKRIRTFTADSTTHRNRLQFYKEALVWQGLRHRFILPLLGIDRSTFAPSFCMVSPWMKHGTVLKYLRDHGREGRVNRLLLEIAQGLDYLHSMNIVHGDLRGNNVLVSDERNACLSDFGLAASIDDADSTTAGATSSSNRAGSIRWFAPELIEPTNFGCTKFIRTKASDVYAYACVCLELYTGHPPFSHLQDVAAMLRVIRGERPEQPPYHASGTMAAGHLGMDGGFSRSAYHP
ncbi:Kinase-like protein [Mycena sanguinolenta]|uniref:Kinase-like protein n=1 Tax=Mycena sanguinolenta TaxID=230812 RepID=A0A8H7CHY3_9AGAR|nr:Kinase-like protein [Mycena sanguinolenta]